MSVAPEPVNPEHDPMTIDPSNLGSVDPLSVEGIFLVALGKQGDARQAFLAASCPDTEQRQRVEALLSAYESAGSFLEKPAISAEPTPVGQYLAPCEVPGAIGKLGPYEILEEIGRGGMGVVFRAHDPKLQRIVAVKALAPELARLPSARQRFLREARAAAAISHPHVVTIFAVDGTEEASLGTERATLPYLVMECIVGQTLHDKIKRVGALKVEEIVRISRQIAEGLGAAHKRGLIHRDIKPANILLENGVERVKITDFGLARTVSDGGITHTGEILGTPQCMSPEQARGEIVDQRSDLFSLGCVMYTMCTGVSPFRADNMLAIMKKVCDATPRPIAELNPQIPEWLGQLVHQLLEKQPELRVQTAGDVVEVLEARAVAHMPQSSNGYAARETANQRGDLPPWLLTPLLPSWRWIQGLPKPFLDVCVLSLMLGFLFGAVFPNGVVSNGLVYGGVVWIVAALVRMLTGRGSWVCWPVFGASMLALGVGNLGGRILRLGTHGEAQGGIFVFGLAIGIFWLLTRLFPKMFIQNIPPVTMAHESAPVTTRQSGAHWSSSLLLVAMFLAAGIALLSNFLSPYGVSRSIREVAILIFAATASLWIFVRLVAWGMSHSQPQAAARPATFPLTATQTPTNVQPTPRSPWSVLGWILVSILGVGMLGVGLFVIALIVPWIAMSNAPKPVVPHSGPHPAHVTIRSSLGERIIGVNVDGSPAFLTSLGQGMCQLKIEPGLRAIVVAFESPDPKNYERIYSTQVNVSNHQAVEIEAVPVNQARMAPKKDISTEFAGRFEAALAMENDTARHNTLVRLAEDAANAGYGELVLNVIAEVDAGTARNNTCAICAEALLKHGMTSAATVVALQMDNNSARHNTLAKIASAAIPAVDSPASVSTPNPQLNSVTMPEPSAVLVEPTPIPDAGIDRNSAAPSPSIPLADAVEVLTDPKEMPAPARGVSMGFEQGMTQAVWIDEPGLLIRMKRLSFEGEDGKELEYYSKIAWGTGAFMATNSHGEHAHHFPAGRYRVLVQDLDYGWQLDRRGMITIGNGPMYVHVKRSFQAHQKLSSGSDQFPLTFRWAGKTYQIVTPEEVGMVNLLLTTLDPQTKATVFVPDSFRTHPLFLEAVQIDPQGGGHSLKRERSVMKIDIRSPGMKAGYKTAVGQIEWSGQAVFEAFVPRQAVQGVLSDDSLGLFEDISIPAVELEAGAWVVRRDLNSIKRCAEGLKATEGPDSVVRMIWFGEWADVANYSVPAARRLVMAIAEGQPDVPEAELLELGHVATLDELWAVADQKPDETLKTIVIPGSTPGTWRLKEPPEGAVAKD